MRALVVYESMYGNTEQVARAVAQGLATCAQVETVEVADAPVPVPDDVELLVVGGPTHALGLSRAGTRKSAAEHGAAAPSATGIREWLADLPPVHDVRAAAFDTHARTRLPGSAAGSARRRLRRLGAVMVAAPASFYVTDTRGPLDDGELDRARRWGAGLTAGVPG
jgi:hypothetical protein